VEVLVQSHFGMRQSWGKFNITADYVWWQGDNDLKTIPGFIKKRLLGENTKLKNPSFKFFLKEQQQFIKLKIKNAQKIVLFF
jgi:hypothetical protein